MYVEVAKDLQINIICITLINIPRVVLILPYLPSSFNAF